LKIYLNGKGITSRAAREKKPVLVKDTRLDPDYVRGSTDSLSELAVPMLIGGEVVGVINFESLRLDYFDEHYASLGEALAAHAASNIERIRATEEAFEAGIRAAEERARVEEAERLEEMKTQFTNMVTHELRTPLTSIKGYMEILEDYRDAFKPPLSKYLQIIKRNADRLERLTSDLLDQQRIEENRLILDIHPVHVPCLVEEVRDEMTPIFEARSQRLLVTVVDVTLDLDRVRIAQVLVNLLSNASKFSPEGSVVKLTVEDHGDEVWFMVQDEGVGIKPEDMPQLFKPFPGIRVPRVKDSTGLGLSICKGIVDLHGGRIWAESEGPGKGSTFTFTIPKHR